MRKGKGDRFREKKRPEAAKNKKSWGRGEIAERRPEKRPVNKKKGEYR